jgi:hypothetical protein
MPIGLDRCRLSVDRSNNFASLGNFQASHFVTLQVESLLEIPWAGENFKLEVLAEQFGKPDRQPSHTTPISKKLLPLSDDYR